MARQTGWLLGLALLGLSIYGVSQLAAQRGGRSQGEVGRYVVVRSSGDVIILLDTATGDLYNAVPSDIKPYASRPHGGARFATPTTARATPATRRAIDPVLLKPEFKEALPDKGVGKEKALQKK